MTDYQPPFQITDTIINNVAQISELMGRLSVTSGLSANPILRRENRIRTIHGSLAIEQNTLSLEQVTAVLNGKNGACPAERHCRSQECLRDLRASGHAEPVFRR